MHAFSYEVTLKKRPRSYEKESEPFYLSVNFALPLEEDVRLGGEGENVPYHRDGRRTGRKARGSSLLDELANQQKSQQGDSQTHHAEESLRARHRHQRLRFD